MRKQNLIIVLTIILASLFSVKINAEGVTKNSKKCSCCSTGETIAMNDSTKMMHGKNHKMMMDSTKKEMDHSKMHGKMHDMKDEKVSIVREGVIDVESIDMNKDGKVYQDQMCWNVISDEAGRCPLCNMKLKEVSLEHAKNKLVEHDYKIKQ